MATTKSKLDRGLPGAAGRSRRGGRAGAGEARGGRGFEAFEPAGALARPFLPRELPGSSYHKPFPGGLPTPL